MDRDTLVAWLRKRLDQLTDEAVGVDHGAHYLTMEQLIDAFITEFEEACPAAFA